MDDGANDEDDGPEDEVLVGHLLLVGDVVLEVVVGSFALDLWLIVLDPKVVVVGPTDVSQASRCFLTPLFVVASKTVEPLNLAVVGDR